MCRHTGLLVCFACLFLSANSSPNLDQDRKSELSFNLTKLFEKHSQNGSLSLEGLDQIFKSIKDLCPSHWKETEPVHSHKDLESVPTDSGDEQSEDPEYFMGNGMLLLKTDNYCNLIWVIHFVLFYYSLALCWCECFVHIKLWSGCCCNHQSPAPMVVSACYSIPSCFSSWLTNW